MTRRHPILAVSAFVGFVAAAGTSAGAQSQRGDFDKLVVRADEQATRAFVVLGCDKPAPGQLKPECSRAGFVAEPAPRHRLRVRRLTARGGERAWLTYTQAVSGVHVSVVAITRSGTKVLRLADLPVRRSDSRLSVRLPRSLRRTNRYLQISADYEDGGYTLHYVELVIRKDAKVVGAESQAAVDTLAPALNVAHRPAPDG